MLMDFGTFSQQPCAHGLDTFGGSDHFVSSPELMDLTLLGVRTIFSAALSSWTLLTLFGFGPFSQQP